MNPSEKAQKLRDELRAIAEGQGARAIVIVLEGDTSAYAYTNMGPGAAVDLLATTRAAVIEGMK